MNLVIFIQARLTSTRLPGKVLLPLGGKTVLERVYDSCSSIARTVVLIPTGLENDKLAHFLSQNAISCFRGPEQDVLKRFKMAYDLVGQEATHIIRVTADCPFLPPTMLEEVIKAADADCESYYVSNTLVRTYPKGFDVELFTPYLLQKADQLATSAYDREHVTPMIQKLASKIELIGQAVDQSMFNVCLDTPEDYERLKDYENF